MSANKSKSGNWVSASEVNRACFCPHYLELKERGIAVSEAAIQARKEGERLHSEFNRKASSDPRCYIATELYGQHDSRTDTLRAYRDQSLGKSYIGRFLIRLYYRSSPLLISLSRKVPLVRRLLHVLVNYVLSLIEETT